jgi:LemA protein
MNDSSIPQALKNPWIIFLGVLAVFALWMMLSYNGLVSSHGAVGEKWAQVETQYQRRMDLVPNLVLTVKGAANFEQETFKQVTEARSQFAQAKTVGNRTEQIAAAGQFDSALSRLLVTVEAYPTLTATQAFKDLMAQLEGTENRIAVARKDYNEAVVSYNVRIKTFPSILTAKLFGFSGEKVFEAAQGADQAPKVDFTK